MFQEMMLASSGGGGTENIKYSVVEAQACPIRIWTTAKDADGNDIEITSGNDYAVFLSHTSLNYYAYYNTARNISKYPSNAEGNILQIRISNGKLQIYQACATNPNTINADVYEFLV